MKININSIKIPVRARENIHDEKFKELVRSIKKNGLLTPITIRKSKLGGVEIEITSTPYILVCGARRLAACKALRYTGITANLTDIDNETDALIAELEENLRRVDFTWQERVIAKSKLFYRMKQTTNITQQKFSDMFSVSVGMTSMELELFDNLGEYPAIIFKDKITSAHEELRRLRVADLVKERLSRPDKNAEKMPQNGQNGAENIDPIANQADPQKSPKISQYSHKIYGSAIEMLEQLSTNSIDCICTDPPFGIDIKRMRKGHGGKPDVYAEDFDDSNEAWEIMIRPCLKEFARVLKPGSHLYMFFPIEKREFISNLLIHLKFLPNRVPLIWVKTLTGAGCAANQPKYLPANAYQSIIMAFAPGTRRILSKQGLPNILRYDTLHPSKKTHPMEIPIEVYQDLMSRSTHEGDLIIDPFCGTGNSLIAALNLGCTVLGSEIREDYRNLAELKVRHIQENNKDEQKN